MPSDRLWTDTGRDLVETVLHDFLTHSLGLPPEIVRPYGAAEAVLDALAAAGRILPEPTDTRIEWGVWWHRGNANGVLDGNGDGGGGGGIDSEAEAHDTGRRGLGYPRITSYSVIRREHRQYPDGWFISHWSRHSGPHGIETPLASATDDGSRQTQEESGV